MSKTIVLASLLTTLAGGAAHADSLWIADPLTPSPFGTAANWDTNGLPVVPGPTDIAFIANGGTATIADLETYAILGLQIDNGAVTLTGGALDSSGSTTGTVFNVGANGFTGSLTAGGASFLTLGAARIGQNGGTGTVTLSGTSAYNAINNGDTWIGDQLGSIGTLTLQDDAQWNIPNNALVVGRGGGTGTLNMSGNSSITQNGNNTYLGDQNGTISTVNMSGFSKLTNTAGEIWIGQNQATTVANLSDDAVIEATNNWIAIGREGSTSTVTLSDRSKLLKSAGGGNIEVGSSGGIPNTATLIARHNSTVQTNNSIHIGVRAGATGVFTVRDNATVDVGSEIWISNQGGTGTMNLEGGQVTLNNWLAVGRENGNGTLNMSGGTLTKNGNGNITTSALGAAPTAVINHSGGAIIVNSGDLWLHESGTSTSTWTATGGTGQFNGIEIHRGGGGSSTFTVDGAAYTATSLTVRANGTLNVNSGSLNSSGTLLSTGGAINFNGGAASASEMVLSGGTSVVKFGATNLTLPKITLDVSNANTTFDTITGYVIKAAQALSASGSAGTAKVVQELTTTDQTSAVSMADGGISTTFTLAGGLDAAAGALLEFDVNGAGTARNDRFLSPDLALGNNVVIKLNNLHLGSMVEGQFYTLTLVTGGLDGGTWLNNANFSFLTDGTIGIDTSFGTNGVLVNTDGLSLQVKISSQPIPEPSSIAMLALGLPGAMLVLRRKRA